MSVRTQLLTRNHPQTRNNQLVRVRKNAKAENGSRETIWCAANFLMFMILGPFAAVPALISMASLLPGDEIKEPQAAGE